MKRALLLASLALSEAAFADGINQIWQDSSLKWNFRYRLEQVQPDGPLEDALASTLRSRLTVNTGKWTLASNQSISALIEADHVAVIGGETYNNTVNGLSKYATIADPDGLDLNQAALLFKAGDSSQITLGRQRLNFGDQRFIGSVGWRQNEQTFDGIRLTQSFGSAVQLDLASLHNANRVFGPDGTNADLHGRFNLAQAQWMVKPEHVLQGYFYDLDFDSLIARSSSTSGLDYKGAAQGFKWQLALANQQDAHLAPTNYNVSYQRMELSYPLGKVTVKGIAERLGSDGKVAFQTPFATLHAFNGFADMFLTTPVNGLREHAVQLAFPLLKTKATVSWHRFNSDYADIHYGNEIGATLAYEVNPQWQLLGKVAFYQADKFQADTRKFWWMVTYQP
ncbi:alginate export family protein [Rheinheimera texasensis]|uniref:alginate export family protein n=1 Tax=Rheinheimera texasensis TaxID=306205 RepID=UPI00068BA3D0|nr:alginate export family protein [Rheinheimera texasensis]